jgi:hypothetical protein
MTYRSDAVPTFDKISKSACEPCAAGAPSTKS